MKPRTTINDAAWQRKQHAVLLSMAESRSNAVLVIKQLDANPTLKDGLEDVYRTACRTLGMPVYH